MHSCLKPTVLSTSTSNNFVSSSQGFSSGDTPTSSVQFSPTVNLSHEYALAIQTNSYSELRIAFNQANSSDQMIDIRGHADISEEPRLLEQFLQPGHERVQEALLLIGKNSVSNLIATYFEHSEHTSRLCLLLYQSVHRARLIYAPMHTLLDDLSLEFQADYHSLSHSQCSLAFNLFLEFGRLENPFLSPDTLSFDNMQKCFSQLRQQLYKHLRKSRSKVNVISRCSKGSALCLIAAGVGVVISAVIIATHALAALVACPPCLATLPSSMIEKERVHLAQIDAATRGVYVLNNDLDTIARLVARLHSAVEADKLLVQLVLERGVDRHAIQETLKQLRKSRPTFVQQLLDLEEHLILCVASVNRARSLLLQEIEMHHSQV